jgi:transcriptional regulator with XRE-family HTH domain
MTSPAVAFLTRIRKERGITQQQVGDTLRVSQSTISRIERGCTVPPSGILPQMAAALQIEGQELADLLDSDGIGSWRAWTWQARLSPGEKLILLALLEHTAQPASIDQVASLTGLSSATVRKRSLRLEKLGVLARIGDKSSPLALSVPTGSAIPPDLEAVPDDAT